MVNTVVRCNIKYEQIVFGVSYVSSSHPVFGYCVVEGIENGRDWQDAAPVFNRFDFDWEMLSAAVENCGDDGTVQYGSREVWTR